jgi:tetratricopeptide (TPR) repeat protein
MGTALHKKGLREEAGIELKKAVWWAEKHIKAHRNLALFSLKDGHLDKAVYWVNKALEIAPDNVTVLGAAGYCYRLRGSFGRAFALFEKTISFDRYDPKVDLYIAEIFFKRKMYDHAIKRIEKFAAGAEGKDLRGYIHGTYKKEDEIEVIRRYKKMVLFALSRAYENKASYLNEKADYLKTTLAEMEQDR